MRKKELFDDVREHMHMRVHEYIPALANRPRKGVTMAVYIKKRLESTVMPGKVKYNRRAGGWGSRGTREGYITAERTSAHFR